MVCTPFHREENSAGSEFGRVCSQCNNYISNRSSNPTEHNITNNNFMLPITYMIVMQVDRVFVHQLLLHSSEKAFCLKRKIYTADRKPLKFTLIKKHLHRYLWAVPLFLNGCISCLNTHLKKFQSCYSPFSYLYCCFKTNLYVL